MKRLENPGLIKSRKNYSQSPINYLASASNVPLRADAAFPQIQAVRSSNFLRENIESWAKAHCLAVNRYMVLRLGYTVWRRPGAAAPLGHQLKHVNERIRCDGFTTLSALELRLLRALQRHILQQRKSVGYCRRMLPSRRIPSITVTSPVMFAVPAIGRYRGGDNLVMTTSACLASAATDS